MIWIITSGTENYPLISLCQQYNLPYCIIADTLHRPHEEQDFWQSIQHIQQLITYGETIWCTHFLLSPIYELYHKNISAYTLQWTIIDLFTNYVAYTYNNSLIWKIGYIWGYSDIQQIETLHSILSKEYKPTSIQSSTKKFNHPLSKRTKTTPLRNQFVRILGKRNFLINTTIKYDLKYFKDANVDTIVPLQYSYFHFQKTITSFFNQKKQKFHKREVLVNIFTQLITDDSKQLKTQNLEITTIHYTWSPHLLTENKKWEALLSQWWQKTIEYKKIVL